MSGRDVVARDLVIVACAISAGIHAALSPGHVEDGAAASGGFVVSAALLAALAVSLTRHESVWLLAAAAVLLSGLIATYALAVTTGIPLLHPTPEQLDGLGLLTKAVELAGLGAAVHLLRPQVAATVIVPPLPKGIR